MDWRSVRLGLLVVGAFLAACVGRLTEGEVGDGGVTDAASDGSDPACESVVCASSEECVAGRCQPADPCRDVVCTNAGEVCSNGACVSGIADEDGDGFRAADDCDDFDADVFPGATELCNGKDDNCDGQVDEGFDQDGDGHTSCGNGDPARADCDDHDGDVNPDGTELCNGRDDDCDGQVDESFEGEGSACGTNEGSCQQGIRGCVGGEPICVGEIVPQPERCDGTDLDCDGVVGCEDRDCDGTTCDSTGRTCRDGSCLSMCDGATFAGYGCAACPRGSFEVYCPGPGCSRACVTDGGCDNRYRHSATDAWIDYAHAFCFSGTTESSLYWEMR